MRLFTAGAVPQGFMAALKAVMLALAFAPGNSAG